VTNRTRVRLCRVSEVRVGAMIRCDIPNHRAVAVYNVDGSFFATEDNCTHGMGSLSEGTLDGDVIECPFHGGAFNVCTGEPVEWPCVVPLKVYATDVDDGVVYVALD